jgi:hypothetical protein
MGAESKTLWRRTLPRSIPRMMRGTRAAVSDKDSGAGVLSL